jgi:hypothetical protein
MVAVDAVGNAPLYVCADGSFPKGGSYLYPDGDDKGQYGWDVGINYKSVPDLLTQLLPLPYQKIDRLALDEHGFPGEFQLTGAKLTLENIATEPIQNTLRSICGFLSPDAVLLLVGCMSGMGDVGTEFLAQLSRFFPGRKVVGFITVGVSLQPRRKGADCNNPGMKITDYDNAPEPGSKEDERRYGNGELLYLKWAHESDPHAKVARDGRIIRSPPEAPGGPSDVSPEAYLPGTWSVTIGDWRGYFLFGKSHDVAWQDEIPTRRHTGKWWARDGSVYWSFNDDQPGWQRTFEVAGGLKSTVQGTATINGVPHGFFTMSKQY